MVVSAIPGTVLFNGDGTANSPTVEGNGIRYQPDYRQKETQTLRKHYIIL